MPLPKFPAIEPLQGDEAERPFWSVMIPTYNRVKYLESTLRSVLAQADGQGQLYGPDRMQIQVVDNASSGPEVEALVRRVGGGRVEFFQQLSNVDVATNWNTCVQRARGQWVHILHDDDVVLPGFYQSYGSFIEQHPGVDLALSRPILMDEAGEWKSIMFTPPALAHTGVWDNPLLTLLRENPNHFVRCPAIVVARRAYEKVGGFDPLAFFTLDWQMWMRVAAQGQVGYIHRPLTLYREYEGSLSVSLIKKKDMFPDIERTAAITMAMLPPELRAQARQGVDRTCADVAKSYRQYVRSLGQHRDALKYSRYAFRYDRSPRVLLMVFMSWLRFLLASTRPKPQRAAK